MNLLFWKNIPLELENNQVNEKTNVLLSRTLSQPFFINEDSRRHKCVGIKKSIFNVINSSHCNMMILPMTVSSIRSTGLKKVDLRVKST